jgi:hypothetical protein
MEFASTKVWKDGRLQDATHDAALTSLCQAVERAVRQHQTAGVRAVILMVDQPVKPEPVAAPVPVYVDVFESGYSHDSGYGHGI